MMSPMSGTRARSMALHRGEVERRIVSAARISLSGGGALDQRLIADVCAAVGIHPHALRQIFPTDDELFEAVHASLVEECAARLRAGVDEFVPDSEETQYTDAARALAEAWPIERGGMTMRADRRARALAERVDGAAFLASERRFVQALLGILDDLIAKLGRRFAPSDALAVRIILDTFERSFEAWILEGHPDSRFAESPYIRRTLPTLLEQLSAPAAAA